MDCVWKLAWTHVLTASVSTAEASGAARDRNYLCFEPVRGGRRCTLQHRLWTQCLAALFGWAGPISEAGTRWGGGLWGI
jgi:hypothetical protein